MFYEVLFYLLGILFLLVALGLFIVLYFTSKYAKIETYNEEESFLDFSSSKKLKFPSIIDKPSCSLSVIVPAYNEENRLTPMLDEALKFLEKRSLGKKFTYEVLIVDDGSTDNTSQIGLKYNQKFGSNKVRVLTLVKNRGKGGAVRLGMLKARGEILLFADADGATKFSDYSKLESSLQALCEGEYDMSESVGIVCGSRAHLEEESVATRSMFRSVLMYGFHFMVWLFTVKGIKDTQCGFKLLTRRSARIIFNSLHVERWAFDVEMLYMAQKLGIPISEVAVHWTEIEGSKVTPVISWIQMGLDLCIIWLRYSLGVWKIKQEYS